MRRFGEVIGPLFAREGFAFFTEAIFLGIYLYGRERVSRRLHGVPDDETRTVHDAI